MTISQPINADFFRNLPTKPTVSPATTSGK